MVAQVPLRLRVSAVLSQTCGNNDLPVTMVTALREEAGGGRLPIWTLSGPMSNTPTVRAMKLRIVLKFMRPMLQEPSTSRMMSALALVLH